MKKLMIAATAALCATVGFSLESANVVGYQDKELNGGANTFVVQTFLPCGVVAKDVTLSTFIPKDGADGWDYYTDFLATL